MLHVPVVLEANAILPKAVLNIPVVLLLKAQKPTAVLFAPVVLLANALAPTLVLLAILPPPSPMLTPLTVMSCVAVTVPVTFNVLPLNVKFASPLNGVAPPVVVTT